MHATDAELLALAQAKLADGRLPVVERYRRYAGFGPAAACALCERVIATGEVEIELEWGAAGRRCSLSFHLRCENAWVTARERRGQQPPSGGSGEAG